MPAKSVEEMHIPVYELEDQEQHAEPTFSYPQPEDVVVSGISGRYPESDNINEFRDNLINKRDMVTDDDRRWPQGLYGLPTRSGKLKDISKFDASFFGVSPKQADNMDPQIRIMLEVCYEALVDAGINPASVRGTKTGVYVGTSASEAHDAWSNDIEQMSGYVMSGCQRAMFANRLSFFFDFNGPSYTVDTACSSSLLAFNLAVDAIKNGQCDAALVTGCSLCLKPSTAVQFQRLGMLSSVGCCKSFDESGSGYCRSESVVAVYLQKAVKARRVYATVVHAKNNADGAKDQGITFPSGEMQKKLLKEVYTEARVDPGYVSYVEAHGTGTKAGDPQELNTIADVFCTKARRGPLLIGSTKSNMGHPEPASGLAALSKIIISMQDGSVPPNLHFANPNPDIPALKDGRLKVCTENTPLRGPYVAVNSFGFGGANVHVLLKSYPRQRNRTPHPAAAKLRLITLSGRTDQGVRDALTKVKNESPNDVELQYLLQESCGDSTPSVMPYRGFTLVNANQPEQDIVEVTKVPASTTSDRRPVWFIFAGMGTQWHGMGRDLMTIQPFRESIMRSANVLSQFNLDLYDMLMHGNADTLNSTLNSFISIAAIQVALVDVLKAIGVKADGLIGHSVGELGCAYADGGLTAEQTVLAAYWRGRCVLDAKLPEGGMAAVGLTWEEAVRRCPEGVVPACHNSIDTITISGPKAKVDSFVEDLKAEGIFAKVVNSAGVAFHSYFMKSAEGSLKEALHKIIVNPKPRSQKWISSSIPQSQWHTILSKFSSAEYHVNNLVSPVLFQEALRFVPDDAICVEIAPHCLLQAILKRSLSTNTTLIGLMKRNVNNINHMLTALGKAFEAGVDMRPLALWGGIQTPVSLTTPMTSTFVQWDHAITWRIPTLKDFSSGGQGGADIYEIDVNTADSPDRYLTGHVIDGRVIYPATGYLSLAWRSLAKQQQYNGDWFQMPVAFDDIKIHRATILPKSGSVFLTVSIAAATGAFEVSENDSCVVSGKIRLMDDPWLPDTSDSIPSETGEIRIMSSSDVYKELRLRGYDYAGEFRGVLDAEVSGLKASVTWKDNWVTMLDTMLQVVVLSSSGKSLRLPTRIKHLSIDPRQHEQSVVTSENGKVKSIPVFFDKELNICNAGGVRMLGLHATVAPKSSRQTAPTLEEYTWQPYLREKLDEQTYRTVSGIVLENGSSIKIKTFECGDLSLADNILPYFTTQPQIRPEYTSTVNTELPSDVVKVEWDGSGNCPASNIDFLICTSSNLVKIASSCLKQGGFALVKGNCYLSSDPEFTLISKFSDFCFCRKNVKEIQGSTKEIFVDNLDYSWVDDIKSALVDESIERIYLKSESFNPNGVVGMVNCLRQEPGGQKVRAVLYEKGSVKDAEDEKKQLNLDLVVNVKQKNKWGSYKHIPIPSSPPTIETYNAFVNVLTRGDLASLRWIENDVKDENANIKADVHYASLNFRDVMLATGKLPPDALPGDMASKECILGMEFSGLAGKKRVMGLVPAAGLATSVGVKEDFLWNIPDDWSLEEAASVPVVYATAFYSLVVRGRLQKGETVLIHSGSGGVGQAAIAIALSMNCTVFTTVGSPAKKEMLLKKFPDLSRERIANSRDSTFEWQILRGTKGRGVDVVLNSLAEEKLQASVRLLASHGRFLEIGKADLASDNSLGMSIFLKNITFHGILLDALFEGDNPDWITVSNLVRDGVKNGVVKPLPTTVFDRDDIEGAFRFMAQGKHIGKVVIKVCSEVGVEAIARTTCEPNKSYLIIGGLGGFGLELAQWLIDRGVKHLTLTSRSGVKTGYQFRCLRKWRENGIKVHVSRKDVKDIDEAAALLKEASEYAPLGGIYNLAMVLKDAFMDSQTKEMFTAVSNPKVLGTMNIDSLTRQETYSISLDHFVVFSSVSCGRGNAGQANYGFANSVMERVCERRRQDGYPALGIQWGAVGDVGVVLDTMGGNDTVIGGTLPQRITSCLSTLDRFLQLQRIHPDAPAVYSSFVLAERVATSTTSDKPDLIASVANILGMKDASALDADTTLADLGLDSLMGVEVKQTLERDFDIILDMKDIRLLTVNKLKSLEGPQSMSTPSPIVGKAGISKMASERYSLPNLMPTDEIININESVKNGDKLPIFIVSPIEGFASTFRNLPKYFKDQRIYALQCTKDTPLTSVQELASHYIKLIRTIHTGKVNVAGYSFGACVAFEMALQLEQEGSLSTVTLLDGSHSYVSTHTTAHKEALKSREAQHAYALATFTGTILEPFDHTKYTADLLKCESDENRYEKLVNTLNEVEKLKNIKVAAKSFVSKLSIGDKYVPKCKLRQNITLVSAKKSSVNLGKSYGLENVCEGNIKVIEVDGDHDSFLKTNEGKDVAAAFHF